MLLLCAGCWVEPSLALDCADASGRQVPHYLCRERRELLGWGRTRFVCAVHTYVTVSLASAVPWDGLSFILETISFLFSVMDALLCNCNT